MSVSEHIAVNRRTLARLHFRVPPERMAEFEMAYQERVTPILARHGLVEANLDERVTPADIFSKVFVFSEASEYWEKVQRLDNDPAWYPIRRELSEIFEGGGVQDGSYGFLLYSTAGGRGRMTPAGEGRGHWRVFGVMDGLAGPHVQSIYQDRDGLFWFGTRRGGVSRYDGAYWTTFRTEDGLAGNMVTAICQDREGCLWFGSSNRGVTRYNPAGERPQFTILDREDGLASNEILNIYQDREGCLWFGTPDGVSRFDGRSFTTFATADGLPPYPVRSIVQDREGYLWFCTGRGAVREGGGVSRYDGRTFRTFTTQDGLVSNNLSHMFQDQEGHLWFCTYRGASCYDGRSFTTWTETDSLLAVRFQRGLQDPEGHFWFCAEGGLSRYNGKAWRVFRIEEKSLANHGVASLIQDRDGIFWVGTPGEGVASFDYQTIKTFTTEDGLPGSSIRRVLQDRDGYLWFSIFDCGVCCFDGETFTNFTTDDGLAMSWVYGMCQDRDGHFWFGTGQGGVSRFDGQIWTTFTEADGLASNRVWSIIQDREGHFWFGTNRGVTRYDGREFETYTAQDSLSNWEVRVVFQDRDGVFWFGTTDVGVVRYDGRTWKVYDTGNGLAGNYVHAIFQDRDGALWFGTDSGVNRYEGTTFTTLTMRDGLAYNGVHAIFQDRDGHMWFGTDGGGVSRYDGQTFQTLTMQDGLAGNVVRDIAQDRSGDLWFVTPNGLTRYSQPTLSPPRVSVDAVVADRLYAGGDDIEVSASTDRVVFEFHGSSFRTRFQEMVYRYRLKGYDAGWTNTKDGRAEYEGLAPGDYTFEVLSVDRDLVYSEPATVKMSVVPDPHHQAQTEALSGAPGEFVGESEALRRVQSELAEVAGTDVTVLILGETGTGKGLAAQALHALSDRKDGPLVQVNCGAIPEGLVESELFGHERGAFTGAVSRKLGKAELAEGGTLFLDEIGDLPQEAQVKLLRLLEERTFERVGGAETLRADVRVIAATNRDLRQMVEAGAFRDDLYFRLQAFWVQMPPLRERREDIPLLAAYFGARMSTHLNKDVVRLSPKALLALQAYNWPGNVRELEHAVQRAVIVCRGSEIRAEDITLAFGEASGGEQAEAIVTLEEHDRRYIQKVPEQTGWVIGGERGAAALLGLKESTLRFRMKKLGVRRPGA